MDDIWIYGSLSAADIETALNTLGELVNMDVEDWADGELSSRQYEVMQKVYRLWLEGQG
jgi:hypothetical protein